MQIKGWFLAVLAVAAVGTAAEAHHGWGGYDTQSPLRKTGTVREMQFQNPHAMLRLEEGGRLWNVVLAPTTRMTARGLPSGSIKVGDQISLEGYLNRAEPDEIRAERITVAGKTVELR